MTSLQGLEKESRLWGCVLLVHGCFHGALLQQQQAHVMSLVLLVCHNWGAAKFERVSGAVR